MELIRETKVEFLDNRTISFELYFIYYFSRHPRIFLFDSLNIYFSFILASIPNRYYYTFKIKFI